jgi:hypothetical protein
MVVTVVQVDLAAPEVPAEMAALEGTGPVAVAHPVTSATAAAVVRRAREVQAEMEAREAMVRMVVPQVP